MEKGNFEKEFDSSLIDNYPDDILKTDTVFLKGCKSKKVEKND